jgi:ATP-binding cassette subfamily B protein
MTTRKMSDGALMRRIFSETRGSRFRLAGIVALDLLATPLFLLAPIPLAIAVDSVLGSKPLPGFLDAMFGGLSKNQLLIVAAVLQVVVVVFADLQSLGSQVLTTATDERLKVSFRARLFSHVQRLSFAFHDSRGTSDSLYRIQYDAQSISLATIEGVIPMLTAAVTLVSVFLVIFKLSTDLALIALAVAPVLVFLSARFKRTLRAQYDAAKHLESSAMRVVQEVLSTFRVVKAFGREDAEHKRFVQASDQSVRANVRVSWTDGLLSLAIDAVTAAGTGAVLYVGVREVQSNALTLGALLVVISYLARLYDPLKTVTRKVSTVQNALSSAQRSFEILDEVPEITDRRNALPLQRAHGNVCFEGVAFSYDGKQEVLRDVSFVVPAGARVGVVGPTGAGKTTIVSLLMRFYDPTEGRIVLDGVDLRDYKVADLRKQFALVLQEPVLFSTTIEENIAYGRPEATPGEVRAAAEQAGAHDFISALPDGYDTLVGERGMRLSGGERQRISLARAFLKHAPILILDEPTSSVDVATEAGIIASMDRLTAGRTAFMIAHRLGTLESCDFLLEVTDGRVVVRDRAGAPPVAPARWTPAAGEAVRRRETA